MTSADYKVEVDCVSATGWSELLSEFADANIYQTWSYGSVRWGERNLSHLVLKKNGNPVAIAQLRIVRLLRVKEVIAYLRWGPVYHRREQEPSAEVLRQMISALSAEYVRRRRMALRIIPNAFEGSRRAEQFQGALEAVQARPSRQARVYRTFLVDLSPSMDELRKKLGGKWRNKLSGAERNGLETVEGDGTEDYRVFTGLYHSMMARKNFETTVDINEFGEMQASLQKGERMRILICKHQGIPVAGLVCAAVGETAIYLLGATADEGLKLKGSYLLQWRAMNWLKAHGFRYYDLGGIDPAGNPGVYEFKSGFSGEDTRQLQPFDCCENSLSCLCMRGADLARGGLRGLLKKRTAMPNPPPAASGPSRAAADAGGARPPA
jgi:lipid II:glycine glycyltransferase (peptidoglycan interpeptide bridge formation enzyme)